jgi:hypothetical protein
MFTKIDNADECRNVWVTHFLGHTAVQFWSDFFLWERFLDAFPAKHLIELGTGAGGLSMFLALQCIQRGMKFDTFDSFLPDCARSEVGKLIGLEKKCHVGNLWTEAGDWVRDILIAAEHPLILAADNGNKPKEVQLFGPLLKPGDMLCVHDYMNEFTDADLHPNMEGRVKVVFGAEVKKVGITLWRWYQVI